MNHMLPEGLHPQPEGYTREELLLAMQQRRVLQARAVLCDERHALHVPLGCCEGVIERAEGARGIAGGQTRDLAILSCVGRSVCFHVLGFFPATAPRLIYRMICRYTGVPSTARNASNETISSPPYYLTHTLDNCIIQITHFSVNPTLDISPETGYSEKEKALLCGKGAVAAGN